MLVLERRLSEVIIIGSDVRVMVVSISGDKVKLGIDAPKNVRVDREEVREAIDRDSTG